MRNVSAHAWLTVFLAIAGIPAMMSAQGLAPVVPAQPNFDPSDVYYQGWLFVREAEKLQSQGQHAAALEKFRSAEKFFETIHRFHPEWKKDMVGERLGITKNQITKVMPLAQQQQKKEEIAVAEIIESGGKTVPVAPVNPLKPSPGIEIEDARMKALEAEVNRLRQALANSATEQGAMEAARKAATNTNESSRNASRVNDLQKQRDELNNRLRQSNAEIEALRAQMAKAPAQSEMNRLNERLRSLDAEVTGLRQALANSSSAQQALENARTMAANDANESARNAARASDLQRQRDELNARLRQSTTELEAMRAKMATAPVQSEMDRLNERLRSVEQERQAMGLALSQSREQQLQSQAKIHTLQADFQAMRQQAADLERNLGIERDKSNEVTSAQLKQLQQLEQTLKQKDIEIATVNNRVASLQKELQESKEAFQELRTEHETVLRERDHMAALLKLNENGRVQQLIEQNMGLAKELREAKERVERISKNNDETNDQLTEALRDLAITKTKIISLQTEKRAQDQRMADLENQLQNNEKAIAAGDVTANSEEAKTLRDIIKRQLREQERRKTAAQLLLNAAKKLSTGGDTPYDQAVALLTDGEVTLTVEEQKILDDRKVDGEIYSPYAGSRARVSAATTEMHQQIDDYTKAAVRAFGAQRLNASREVLEMILDLHPGHIPTMTKLGIVQMRLDDPVGASQTLRAAVENDETRSLSHRLLGLALYKMGDLSAAETSLTRAIEIDPNDAASHTIYGNTLLRMKRVDDAERAYQKAILVNPQSAEALHNLALLCQHSGRTKEAKEHYEEALLNGAQPNPDLEAAFRKNR